MARVCDALCARPAVRFGWLLAFALLTRAAVFGDLTYFGDETFYFIVGQKIHEGLLPYVDLWDRKGPGLFLTYWVIAGISHSVLAYQIAAWLYAAGTAGCIALISRRFVGPAAAMLGAMLYLVTLPTFGGAGGQSPVFYNLYVALAALLVLQALPALDEGRIPRRIYAAMALAGFAMTFKQTAAVEGAFLGAFVLWRAARVGRPSRALAAPAGGMIAAGCLPFALFAAGYAALGHFPEFWHAMVTANLRKTYDGGGDHWTRIFTLLRLLGPVLFLVVRGMLVWRADDVTPAGARAFLYGWLGAAVGGLVLLPNFYDHYTLPVLVPLVVAAALGLGRRGFDAGLGVAVVLLLLVAGPALRFQPHRDARAELLGLADDIAARDPHPRLLVISGSMYLYTLLNSYPPSPLLNSTHLISPLEDNVSHLDTAREVERILAWRPTVVVTAHDSPPSEENSRTAPLFKAYLRHCTFWFTRRFTDHMNTYLVDTYGCAGAAGSPHPERIEPAPRSAP